MTSSRNIRSRQVLSAGDKTLQALELALHPVSEETPHGLDEDQRAREAVTWPVLVDVVAPQVPAETQQALADKAVPGVRALPRGGKEVPMALLEAHRDLARAEEGLAVPLLVDSARPEERPGLAGAPLGAMAERLDLVVDPESVLRPAMANPAEARLRQALVAVRRKKAGCKNCSNSSWNFAPRTLTTPELSRRSMIWSNSWPANRNLRRALAKHPMKFIR